MHSLIRDEMLAILDSGDSSRLDDAAELSLNGSRLAFSTDTFVVKPIFFPGGDIGSLAVSGTVNDVLMKGARPLWLSLGIVMKEGFKRDDLRRILESASAACRTAGVSVVTGDTKVVGRGELDGIAVNTAGIGAILPDIHVGGTHAKPGDAVMVSGDIGRHGIAVMTERNGLRLTGNIDSDAAPLTHAVIPLLEQFGASIHVLRDPTRGGIAATLNEIAESSSVTVVLDESSVPVSEEVEAVSEILGFDPLHLPCEGRFLAFVDRAVADDVTVFLSGFEGCRNAAVIGTVESSIEGEVLLDTLSGGRRILDMPSGELLPRIC